MQLQNQEDNQELQTLISAANEAIASFNQIQEKANVLKTNIDRNKKMIEALQSENEELQAKSDKVTVSETGEVNFSEFDDFSDQIFANVRKIKALDKVIEKFEKELKYLVFTDLNSTYKTAEDKVGHLYNFYGEKLISELFEDNKEFRKKLRLTFRLISSFNTSYNPADYILNKVKSILSEPFTLEPETVNDVVLPEINRYKIYSDSRPWIQQKIINDLKKELGKE